MIITTDYYVCSVSGIDVTTLSCIDPLLLPFLTFLLPSNLPVLFIPAKLATEEIDAQL
jgi:hypothetical protein